MCDLRQAVVGAWRADALHPNDGRRSGQVDPHLWDLPCLWGRLFSRLPEQLGLLSGGLTPRGEETLVRRASWMPFESAQELLQDLLGVRVSEATARRATLATGEAALAVWEREEERDPRRRPPKRMREGTSKRSVGMAPLCTWWEASGSKSRP